MRTDEILLKDTHLGEIPDMKSAVSPRAGQDSLVMRGPLDLNVKSLNFLCTVQLVQYILARSWTSSDLS